MKYQYYLALSSIILSLSSHAESSSPQKKSASRPTLDIYNQTLKKAYEDLGLIKNYGKQRLVAKGATPEIIIKGNIIHVNTHQVSIGDNLSKWKQILPGEPRCIIIDEDANCNWDDLGIYVNSHRGIAYQICIFLVREPWDTTQIELPGITLPPLVDWQPKHAFVGYLELDGFGMDSKTKFWEIRAAAERSRNLDCGLYDCSFPDGSFGKDRASISFDLSRNDEYGTVKSMTIATDPMIYVLDSKGRNK